MSAPDTNTEKQVNRHRPALGGMAAVVIFAVLLLAGLAIWVVTQSDGPQGADAQVDGRTGEIVEE